MLREDVNLQLNDIQLLSDPDQVAAFFGRLGYDIDTRLPLSAEALSINNAELQRQITHVEQIANHDGELYVYLFEMKSIRAGDRLTLARSLRNAIGEFLLVITSDYQKLDFVLLERQAPDSAASGLSRKQVAIHPHVLSVNRANPDPVDLRVLRRFSYTEDDPFYQYDKLRSAYTVAAWSEPLFNNRALFSDYYLNTRLRDSAEWGEDPLPVYTRLQTLLANVRARLAQEDEAATRRELLEPVFEALGFRVEAFANGTENPDYRLYDPQAGPDAAPLARCLAYKWDRYLDGPDDKRDSDTPDENPGAKVVSLLEEGETPYVIVTNGKLWRLYAARAHSRATNYYEIDLSEAILPADADDRADSIRYFWLFFRRDAFVQREAIRDGEPRPACFLDRLLEGSAAYAKELEDRLKDRIFEQIFPHFAEGFITYIRQQEGKDADLSQARLDGIYRGTLTFLYRLMFLLYAEARDLLPVKDEHGYHTASLSRMKDEIATAAGEIEDAAPEKLRKAYAGDSTALYDRLAALFAVIDRGAPGLNVPRYNGGLFITQPPEDGGSPDYEDARFLRDCKIPDRFLALGLDRMARDVDSKTHALVMIDYKSLGVRQLGSIYEGLLEFRLRVAPEKMAIVKGKRTEEVVPYRGAKKKDILTAGRGASKQERTLPKDAVYLENTRQERKATGSYYTPDYIVQYIVAHTVGPVLAEKFAALGPRLAEAERLYHQRSKNAQAKGEDPEKFWNNAEMQTLAYDVLDVKVLDPAMGSGHFLVEAVDFITDRMIKFLNGYRHNPVRASLQRTRQSILDAMDEQGVSIDHRQLDEIPLLKRQVLKRCVYGVDLNPMAVELAKVSLWLDAFTLGAPLSFLDHHLRHGNSLIGVFDLSDVVLPGSGRWNEIARAAANLVRVSSSPDATDSEVLMSKQFYHAARRDLKAAIERLNVRTAAHFVDLGETGRAEQYAYLDAEGRAIEEKTTVDKFKQAQAVARNYTFFHWKLEFPEVFIELERTQWKENAGFDAVIGNPPYDELSEESLGRSIDERGFLTQSEFYKPTQESSGRLNWYHYFMVLALQLLASKGQCAFIVPLSWLGDSFTAGVRKWMLENHVPTRIEAFPQKDDPYRRVFFDAKLSTNIYIAQKDRSNPEILVRVHPGKDIVDTDHYHADVDTLKKLSPETWIIPMVSQKAWQVLQNIEDQPNIDRLAVVGANPTSGEIIFNKATRPYLTENDRYDLVLRGSHVQRYELAEKAKQGQPVYLKTAEYLSNTREDAKAYAFEHPRIVYQEGSAIDAWRRVVATYLPENNICGHKICYFTDYKIDMFAFLAVYSSFLMNWLVEALSVTNSLPAYLVGNLPFPSFDFTTPADRRAELAEEGRALYARSLAEGHAPVLAFTDRHIDAGETDVIHDLLAFLAETMIALNKQKQAETRRFLVWLEGQIGAAIDDLSGKTIIQGYLGDYQKDEPETDFATIYDRLHRNRSKIAANLNDAAVEARLRAEYERSLGALLPLKRQLAHTDALIDQVVYRLYGLTEDEIAIVEGRG